MYHTSVVEDYDIKYTVLKHTIYFVFFKYTRSSITKRLQIFNSAAAMAAVVFARDYAAMYAPSSRQSFCWNISPFAT